MVPGRVSAHARALLRHLPALRENLGPQIDGQSFAVPVKGRPDRLQLVSNCF